MYIDKRMKKRLLYISILAAAVLASCVKNPVGERTLSGTGEKTPIDVNLMAVADNNSAGTKAAGREFVQGDQFVAYLRHVTWNGGISDARNLVNADKSPVLVTFTKGSAPMAAFSGSDIKPIGTNVALGLNSGNTKQTSDLTASPALYWDDFSVGGKGDATDIRTSDHYLQSFYGYCFNGGVPDSGTELDTPERQAAGVIGWTVLNAQDEVPTSPEVSNFQKSDLLWSAEQTPISYAHVDLEGKKNHGTLQLPFTHAMSKVTIEIVLKDGFDTNEDGSAKAFGASSSSRIPTTPTIFANRAAQVTAPTLSLSTTVASEEESKIQMYLSDDETTNKKHRVYEAIIAPTVFKNEQKLAEVTVDGNKYDINLTNAVLTTVPEGTAWSSQLKAYTIASTTLTKNDSGDYTAENGGITLPGVNYRIKVTLNKQKIDVVAYITDWTDVNASVDGAIMFDADVKNSDAGSLTAVTSTSFDLWRSTTNADATSYDDNGDEDGIQKASTYTYSTGKWVGDPSLFWANGTQTYYFRALAQVANPSTEPNVITTVGGSQAAVQGTDLLWAQTSAHDGKDAGGNTIKTYAAGDPINPRTGAVPMTFEHAMSKVSVLLKTDKDASGADIPDAAQVNVSGAKITIINLYDCGTINISTGNIESLTSPRDDTPTPSDPRTVLEQPVSDVDGVFGWRNNIVIPQSLVEDRDHAARNDAPTFYQSNELTAIYPNPNPAYETVAPGVTANTSIGTGEATYYLTSDLTPVDVVNFSGSDEDAALINEHNATLPGHKSAGDEKEPAKTKSEFTFTQFNEGQLHKNITEDQYASLPEAAKIKTPAEMYTWDEYKALKPHEEATQDEYDALEQSIKDQYPNLEAYQNAQPYAGMTEEEFNNLDEATRTKTAAVLYEYAEYHALDALTEPLFTALPNGLVVVPAVPYSTPEANEYNATLPGAWHVGDVKVPEHYKMPAGDITPHNAGEPKSAGNKIMMYITLADDTRYVIDLASCRDSEDNEIEKWQRGKHYTYTISLAKEQITFRAMIKDWVEKTGSGNANLEWD